MRNEYQMFARCQFKEELETMANLDFPQTNTG